MEVRFFNVIVIYNNLVVRKFKGRVNVSYFKGWIIKEKNIYYDRKWVIFFYNNIEGFR